MADAPEDSFLGTGQATTGVAAPLKKPFGITSEPPPKSVVVEREADPEARRDNEVVRKD